jgi:hypothetical protein
LVDGTVFVGGFAGAVVVEKALALDVPVHIDLVLSAASIPGSSVAAAGWGREPGPAGVLVYSDLGNAAVVDNNVLALAVPLFPIPLSPVDVALDNADLVLVANLVGFPPMSGVHEADYGASGDLVMKHGWTDEHQTQAVLLHHRPVPSFW